MSFIYNKTYYNGKQLYDTRNDKYSFKIYKMSNGYILGMFQGSRGGVPKLDFILKYLEPGKRSRLRTPSHTHWIVDILLKMKINKGKTYKFIKYYYNKYDKIEPFNSIKERNNYIPFTPKLVRRNLGHFEIKGTYPLDYLSHLIELFIKCEKRTKNAFMFKGLLKLILDYYDGKKDYYQIISHSKRV